MNTAAENYWLIYGATTVTWPCVGYHFSHWVNLKLDHMPCWRWRYCPFKRVLHSCWNQQTYLEVGYGNIIREILPSDIMVENMWNAFQIWNVTRPPSIRMRTNKSQRIFTIRIVYDTTEFSQVCLHTWCKLRNVYIPFKIPINWCLRIYCALLLRRSRLFNPRLLDTICKSSQPCIFAVCILPLHLGDNPLTLSCFKAVHFRRFQEPGTRNWKSSDTWVPVNNFVKTHKYSRMYKITNMNTSFSFIRVIINVDLL